MFLVDPNIRAKISWPIPANPAPRPASCSATSPRSSKARTGIRHLGIQQIIMQAELAVNRMLDNIELPK